MATKKRWHEVPADKFGRDTPEMVQKCLNCPYDYCIGCLSPQHVHGRKFYIRDGYINYRQLDVLEAQFVSVYPTVQTDEESGKLIGCHKLMARSIRQSLGLPPPAHFSEGEKRLMLDPWLRRGM